MGLNEEQNNLNNEIKEEIKVKLTVNEADEAIATVTTKYIENGLEKTKDEVITGTLEEVEAKVNALKGKGIHGEHHFKLDASKGEKSKMVKVEIQQEK